VLIILILTRQAKKIPLGCPELIRLWTPRSVAAFYVSLTAIPGIIRFLSKKKTKSRHHSSLHLVCFDIQLSHAQNVSSCSSQVGDFVL
jgi:hypothetical protein